MAPHLFLAGVPATGKSWLGSWLAEQHGYVHIDAERNDGADFDRAEVHEQWNQIIETGRATNFVAAIDAIGKPVVVNWGFLTRYLYVVSALQAEGVQAWWLHADRDLARVAFIQRGGIDPRCFDQQMDAIEREWLLISSVFGKQVITAIRPNGIQRRPEDLWSEIAPAA